MKRIQSSTKPSPERAPGPACEGRARRAYSPPQIACWGDVRDLTLGGSAGQFDSANPSFTQV